MSIKRIENKVTKLPSTKPSKHIEKGRHCSENLIALAMVPKSMGAISTYKNAYLGPYQRPADSNHLNASLNNVSKHSLI